MFNVLKKSIEPSLRFSQKRSNSKITTNYYANDLRKTIRSRVSTKLSRHKIVSKRHILKVFSSHFIKAMIIFRCIYYYYAKIKVGNVFAIYFKTNIQNFFVLVYFVCHTPQFKMLAFAFQSEIWIAKNFNFSVFEVFVYRCHGNIDFHKM